MDKLLLIDDEVDVQYSFRRIFDSLDIELTTAASGEEGLKLIPKVKPDHVIMDVRMDGMNGLETLRRIRQTDAKLPVIMMTAYGTTQTAIEAMKLGAYDYLLKPFDVPKLKQLVAAALQAARDMKQVVSYQPLLESEDYALGIGKFEQCDKATIFLDEIGDMSLATQTRILRVLQAGTFERVGGNQPIRVDVRVIAATNKPLEHAVSAKEFREDLFYRLNVVRIKIPSLRERREDIPLLVNYFLKKFAQAGKRPPKSIATAAL